MKMLSMKQKEIGNWRSMEIKTNKKIDKNFWKKLQNGEDFNLKTKVGYYYGVGGQLFRVLNNQNPQIYFKDRKEWVDL